MHLVIYDLTEEVKGNSLLKDALHKFVNHYHFGAMRETDSQTLLYIAWEDYNVPYKKKYQEILEETKQFYFELFDKRAIQLVHDVITNPETKSDYMDLLTT